jgi:hypothetical protein
MANVVIAVNGNRKNQKTVNIVTGASKPGNAKGHNQMAASANTAHQFATYQDSGGNIKGLPTIYVASYSGPA